MEPYTFTDDTGVSYEVRTVAQDKAGRALVLGGPTEGRTLLQTVCRELLRVVEERESTRKSFDELVRRLVVLEQEKDWLLRIWETPTGQRIVALEAELEVARYLLADASQRPATPDDPRVAEVLAQWEARCAALEAENARLRAALSEEACPEFIHNGGVAISRCARCGMGKSAHVRG